MKKKIANFWRLLCILQNIILEKIILLIVIFFFGGDTIARNFHLSISGEMKKKISEDKIIFVQGGAIVYDESYELETIHSEGKRKPYSEKKITTKYKKKSDKKKNITRKKVYLFINHTVLISGTLSKSLNLNEGTAEIITISFFKYYLVNHIYLNTLKVYYLQQDARILLSAIRSNSVKNNFYRPPPWQNTFT